MELFAERAHAARPGLDLTGDADRFVADICRRVDGLPLAIELAAARVNALGLSEIVSSLDRRFALLEGGQRVSEERRALETLVAWSYDLLHTDEKTLLHQLAVHRGGASLPALVAAAAQHGLDETTATQLVRALVDKSVVTATFPGGNARYDLLPRSASTRSSASRRAARSTRRAARTPSTSLPSPTRRGTISAAQAGSRRSRGCSSKRTTSGPRSRTRVNTNPPAPSGSAPRWAGTSRSPSTCRTDGASSRPRWPRHRRPLRARC